jgi:hypothetical protein
LTKYYDPVNDAGVGEKWQELTTALNSQQQKALLGESFGLGSSQFDPGRQGSYFQTPALVRQSIQYLGNSCEVDIASFREFLASVASNGKGLYVTF